MRGMVREEESKLMGIIAECQRAGRMCAKLAPCLSPQKIGVKIWGLVRRLRLNGYTEAWSRDDHRPKRQLEASIARGPRHHMRMLQPLSSYWQVMFFC